MATFFAYFSVVLIWATTPLAIQWSSHSLSLMNAVLGRTLLALVLALPLLMLLGRGLFVRSLSYSYQVRIYFAASLGIFPNMPLVYWAAQYIPSGLVAVIFALSPLATGVLSIWVLGENPFTRKRLLALLLASVGLAVIFCQQLQLNGDALYGIGGILLSCFLFSASSVLVKKYSAAQPGAISALQQAGGALLFALPGLLLCGWWWPVESQAVSLPVDASFKSAAAVAYLAVVGSLLGGALFFFILQRLGASLVSLVTLMTPVLAIVIGRALADESLPATTMAGVCLVLLALLLYSPWAPRKLARHLSALWAAAFYRRLAQPSTTIANSPEAGLEKARDDMIRFR